MQLACSTHFYRIQLKVWRTTQAMKKMQKDPAEKTMNELSTATAGPTWKYAEPSSTPKKGYCF